MVYKKKYKRYAKKYGKKTVAPAIKSYVHRAITRNIETKVKEYQLSNTWGSVSTNWVENAIEGGIGQGEAGNERIGRSIQITEIELKGVLMNGVSNLITDDNRNLFRLVIGIWDNSTTPCQAVPVLMWEKVTKALNSEGNIMRILYDKTFSLCAVGRDSTGYLPMTRNVYYKKRFKPALKITWSDDTSDYPDKRLVVSMMSDSAAVSNPGFITGFLNLSYNDA